MLSLHTHISSFKLDRKFISPLRFFDFIKKSKRVRNGSIENAIQKLNEAQNDKCIYIYIICKKLFYLLKKISLIKLHFFIILLDNKICTANLAN